MASVLAIGILLIKAVLRQKLSARFHYCIWFMLVLRLIVPFTVKSPLDVFGFIPQYQQRSAIIHEIQQSSSNNQDLTTNINSDDQSDELENKNPTNIRKEHGFHYEIFAWIWLIVAIGVLLYIITVNLLLTYRMKRLSPCERQDIMDIMEQCKLRLKVKFKVSVAYDVSLKSPMLYGFIDPKIIISSGIIHKLSPEEIKYIFMHELAHLKRKDLLVNIVCMLIQTVYWFNPIILYSIHKMKQDCEIACDATALLTLRLEEHKKYGQTIINMLKMLSEPHWIPGTLGFVSKYNKRRIIMITQLKKASFKWTAAALLTLTILAGCSSLGKPSTTNGTAVSPNPTQQDEIGTQNENGTTNASGSPAPADSNASSTDTESKLVESRGTSKSIVYKNTEYGFDFTLPDSWDGYTIIKDTWKGLPPGKTLNDSGVVTGPMISIRHPLWTSKDPRQDIPIMIFTIGQWNAQQQDKFHIGAAPIRPKELGHNSKYYFALPARYNFAFPIGVEEVETILENKPLQPTEQ